MKNRIKKKAVALAAGATLAAVALAGCTSASPTPGSESAPSAASVFEHVHGLGIDSSENVLVASHSGIYRVDAAGELSGPLGGEPFDAMGFTSAGDEYFVSGHPSAGSTSFAGPNLGLLSSADAGESWKSVSLAGATDFHALTVNQNDATRLYGLSSDGAPLLASADGGATWSEGASIQAYALVADPNTPDRLFATTPEGVVVSDDAGQSFNALADAPLLYLLAAAPNVPDALVGVDVEGAVWVRDAEAGTWSDRGLVEGTAYALAVGDDGQRIALIDDRGLVESFDGGQSWTVLIAV
ncbi:group-specific protein [marine actinobacterium PHSC20C1]|nr:group-specific protein [marine actinobacterium PHSC20C1]